MKRKMICIVVMLPLANICPIQAQNQSITGSKNYITQEFKIGEFQEIELVGSNDIYYTQNSSGHTELKIYASDNIMDILDIKVTNGVLSVSYKKGYNIRNSGTVKVMVTNPGIRRAHLSGAGDIVLKNGIRADNFEASLKGSGDIKGKEIVCNNLTIQLQGSGDIVLNDIQSSTVTANLRGSGDIALSGTTGTINYDLKGSGDIKAVDLQAEKGEVTLAGSGDIKCYVTDYLRSSVRGSGDIRYKGDPKIDHSSKRGLKKM
ncbi:MAG: DUF2807 domain-containing protein, partial [Bacteroides sp.]|nr:DUF2807 domain-containing protein [Bacteroides sp.]